MKIIKNIIGSFLLIMGLGMAITSFTLPLDMDGLHSIKAHLNFIEGLITLIGGLIIFFMPSKEAK
jgi:uncharacterized membrane protein HdeD (DUF308 family)